MILRRVLRGWLLMILLSGGLNSVMATAASSVRSEMLVSTDWLAAHANDPDLVVLCIASDSSFYEQGHIPGARLIQLDQLVTQGETLNALPPVEHLERLFGSVGIRPSSRIVIYGEKQGMLAARAYFTLDYLGLADHAALLDGGMEKWRAEQRPESKVHSIYQPVRLELKPNPAVVVTLDEMQKLVEGKTAALIDARPTPEYTGDRRSEDVPRSGHIPGASGIYWMNLLVSKELPMLKPEEQLRSAFETAGASTRKPVVTYCRTGMQAAFDYFVAKYLGMSPRMYVSSFYEWSRKNVPVEIR